MKSSIKVSWLDDMAFETQVNGHKIVLDASDDVGGKDRGPRPKPLMLVSLAGCTGMDVISLLRKMRLEVTAFDIEVQGDITEEHPMHYNKIHVVYHIWGKNLDMAKIEKAVSLSESRYCGVFHVYKKAIEMSFEIKTYEAE